jgi:hypothetical protein
MNPYKSVQDQKTSSRDTTQRAFCPLSVVLLVVQLSSQSLQGHRCILKLHVCDDLDPCEPTSVGSISRRLYLRFIVLEYYADRWLPRPKFHSEYQNQRVNHYER